MMGEKDLGDSLRAQLSETNARARFYATQIWQVPFAYIAVCGVIAGVGDARDPLWLAAVSRVCGAIGIPLVVYVLGLWYADLKAVDSILAVEKTLGLEVTVKHRWYTTWPIMIVLFGVVLALLHFGWWSARSECGLCAW
jgi:hypothetical protein